MEDAHVLDLDFHGQGWVFCGVYDGHRGRTAAMTAAEHLHTIFLHHLQKRQHPEEAMTAAYREVDHMLVKERSGTTAVNVFIRERDLLAANAGDSRCLLVRRQDSLQLSADHRLSNPEEKERVRQTGAVIQEPYIMVGASGLMPTRSLGDQDFAAAGVIPDPFVHRKRLNQDDIFLILACDGLFDVMSNQEVAEVVRSAQGPEEAARNLMQEALEVRMSADNLTVICLELMERRTLENTETLKGSTC
jgi:serine/threonine protein phosphatase PrpC